MANTEQPHKYFEDQFDDEEVLHVFHKHPIVMRKGLILGMGAWLLGPVYTLVLTYIHKSNPPHNEVFLAKSFIKHDGRLYFVYAFMDKLAFQCVYSDRSKVYSNSSKRSFP